MADDGSDVGGGRFGDNSRVGWLMFGCAAIAAVVVAVQPSGGYRYRPEQLSLYDWTTWVEAAVLAVAGVTVARAPRHRVAAAVLGLSAGAQLAGTGVVARRRWFTSAGWVGGKATNMGELRLLAGALAGAGTVAAAAALYMLWTVRPSRDHRGAIGGTRLTIVAAVVVAVLVPLALGHAPGNAKTQVVAYALMYSLPWACVLATAAWIDARWRLVAPAAVLIGATLMWAGPMMIPALRPGRGFSVAVLACLAVAAMSRLRPARGRAELTRIDTKASAP